MTHSFRWRHLPALALLCLTPLAAQELSVVGGGMSTRDVQFSTYTWQLDYQQNFSSYFAGSMALINEGHIVGHHRDGTAFEVWARLPLLKGRLALAVGGGAYYYYDTQPLPGGDTANVHGLASIYSATATAYLNDRWFLKGVINRINPHDDVKTNTTAVGVGFWFGQERKPTKGKMGDSPEQYAYVTPHEFTLFGGQSIVNTLFSEHALAGAVEYRRGLRPHIDWTASAIYEGDPQIVRRNGIATQLWAVNTFFDRKVCVGAGLGPYFYIDHKHPSKQIPHTPAAAAPLLSLSVSTRLSDHWLARLVFDRVTTDYNRDADIILLGFGYYWGGKSG
jgi:hypothetical protein